MILSFDIGGSHIKAAWAKSAVDLIPIQSVATPLKDYDALLHCIAQLLISYRDEVRGLSISITGVVDPHSGILKCANIPCADGQSFAKDIHRKINLPVWIYNDADCFALAEATTGVGQGHQNVFAIILGSGVGGGLVIDGSIVKGAGGFVGEWGHGTIVKTRLASLQRDIPHFDCGCGRKGCVNTIGGARGLEALHQFLSGKSQTSRAIVEAWLGGETQSCATLSAYFEMVCEPLALTLNVTGSSIVPVGGGLGREPRLVATLDQHVRQKLLRVTDSPLLIPSRDAIDSGLVGAAIAGFQEMTRV